MRMPVLATFVIGACVGWLVARRAALPYAPGFVQRNAEPTWVLHDGSVTYANSLPWWVLYS